MGCSHKSDSSCPFAWTEQSEIAQNYGCLPTHTDIMTMRVKHGKTWACHDDYSKPCTGAIAFLKEKGLPYKVIDKELVRLDQDWERFCANARAGCDV